MNIIQELDDAILLYVLNHLHSPFMDKFMISITTLGNSRFIWIVITFFLLLNKRTRCCGIVLTVALSVECVLGEGLLKQIFGRARPFIRFPDIKLLINKPGSYSFPSGHTMSSFTAATVIFHAGKYAGIPAYLLAGLIGFSRVYLFVHYPTDVLAGAVFGIVTAFMVIWLVKTIGLNAKFA
ncbi:phosphatase PAP2 family protein [Anaerocolumna sedimenticola]|uniref:phosphatase PAP2 family protein n=1 Tax=Anaerocolumna sedimenticola TaxID=2696063 RepID=UPI00192A4565|nr:phosphatase PAP2 family protein [Anaerocolumna sedimenticola]